MSKTTVRPTHQPTASTVTHTSSPYTPQQPTVLTNHQFYMKCVQVGSTAKTAVREFLALLPEAEDRKIYLDHGMTSIFEFAAKLGGVSREQVQRVLQLSERFETTPLLKQALVSGYLSLAKLARVASVATPDNQDFWLSKALLLSQPALETLVRDSKAIVNTDSVRSHSVNPNKTAKVSTSRIEKVIQSDELNLNPDVKQELLELQNKGLDINQLLREMLEQRKHQIRIGKQLKQPSLAIRNGGQQSNSHAPRYIPVKVRRILKQEYGEKCAHSNCTNVSVNIHHQNRFASDPSHNPLYMVPVCKYHHEIAHSIDIKVVRKRHGHRG